MNTHIYIDIYIYAFTEINKYNTYINKHTYIYIHNPVLVSPVPLFSLATSNVVFNVRRWSRAFAPSRSHGRLCGARVRKGGEFSHW